MKVPSVRDLMVTRVITLRPEMDIYEAINHLLKNRISGAPVVDAEMHPVGMLSEKDCLRIFANGAYHQIAGRHVSEYMSVDLSTVSPDDGLFTVADIFLRNAFRRLPVVEDGILVGQISRRDVLDGSRKIWELSPMTRPWTDSKYLSEELKAALKSPGTKDYEI
ncbi:MAG: CBS domain-containing protein [Verrucomicrobia bacterium]|nr:CBS domain-containing protein [Verrucomicrobiota bacterium]